MTDNITPSAEFFAELAKAQNDFAPVRKNRVNPATRSQYADLQSVLDAVKPALNAHGFFLFQRVTCSADAVGVETFLGRGTEQLSSGVFSVPFASLQNRGTNAAQALGSARTYACRYSLCSFLCVVAEDDDDGNASNEPAPQQDPWKPQRPVVSAKMKETAEAAAAKGMESYKTFFATIDPSSRKLLVATGVHATLKQVAENADRGAAA